MADIIGRLAVVVSASAAPLASGLAQAAQASQRFAVGAQADMNAVAASAARMGAAVQQQAMSVKAAPAISVPPPVLSAPAVPPIPAPAVPAVPPVRVPVNVAATGLQDAARQADEFSMRVNAALGKLDAGGKVGPFVGRVRQLMRDLPADRSADEFAMKVKASLANLKGHDSVTLFTREIRAALQQAGAGLPIARAAPIPVAVKMPTAGDKISGLSAMAGSVSQLFAALPGGGMFAGLTMQAAGATGALGNLASGLGSTGLAAAGAAGPIGLIAAAIAAVAAIAVGAAAAVYGWARSVMSAVASQVRLADRLGITVEGLQRLAYALQAGGVSGEDLSSVLNKVEARIGELRAQIQAGGGEMVTAFQRLNLPAAAFADMPLDRQVLTLSDALGRIPNAADRAVTAHRLLGRGAYESLGPVLARGRAWIEMQGRIAEGAGAVIPAPDARALAAASSALKMAWATFGAIVTGVGNSLALALGPPIKAVADVVNGFFQAAAASGLLKAVVNVLGGALAGLGVVAIAFVAVLATPLIALVPLFLTLAAVGWGLWQALKAIWTVGSAVGRVLKSFASGLLGPLPELLSAVVDYIKAGWAGVTGIASAFMPILEAVGELIVGVAGVAGAVFGLGDGTRSFAEMIRAATAYLTEAFRGIKLAVVEWSIAAVNGMLKFVDSVLFAVQTMRELRAEMQRDNSLAGRARNFFGNAVLPGQENLSAAAARLEALQARLRDIRRGIGRAGTDAGAAAERLSVKVEVPEALSFESREAVQTINANILNAGQDAVVGAIQENNALTMGQADTLRRIHEEQLRARQAQQGGLGLAPGGVV
jgi:hypothetical protein